MTSATASTADRPDFDDFDPTARWIVVVATAEARLARHPIVSSAHLVLAGWLAASTPTGQALREAGLSGRIAKAWLDHEIRPETRTDEPVNDADLLARIRAIAHERGSARITSQHIFEAATEHHDLDGVRMLRAQGISADRIRHLVDAIVSQPPAPSLMERLSEAAGEIIVSAGAHARAYQHDHLHLSHLLLGLIDTDSAAGAALRGERVTPEAAHLAFIEIVGPGDGGPTDHVPFSAEAQHVLGAAARKAGSGDVTPEHLLVAMIDHGAGDDQEILRALGADIERLHALDDSSTERATNRRPASPSTPRRQPNLDVLRPVRDRAKRPSRGWRPEILLLALAFLPVLGGQGERAWIRLGFSAAAVGAAAVGAGAVLRALTSRRGPWRHIRVVTAGALTLAAISLLLGAALS